MTLLIVSFVAGVLTILAPCILPLLPVIVGHSITDTSLNKRRLFTVVISLGLSVIAFTLLLKVSALFVNIPQDFWKWISGGVIFLFGLSMVFPALWDRLLFLNRINVKSNKVLMEGYKKDSIWGDVIIGASLGPIFSACSPTYFVILATVLPASPVLGLVYLLAYILGLCLTLLLVSFLGQKIAAGLGAVSDPRGWFKRIMGVIFILVAIAILTGYDKKLQIKLLDAGFFDETKIEQKLLDANSKTSAGGSTVNDDGSFLTLAEKEKKFEQAPDISTPDGFINTGGSPINISDYRGKKVVLLDIWTYSCINCQRTIPYLNEWYKKYEDQGLVIIGLSTPEFSFEKVQANVEKAVAELGIKYPVVLDNDFSTWNAYGNQYWPREYLIDIDGFIVHDHAGEGEYDVTEKAIQDALKERDARLGVADTMPTGVVDPKNKVAIDMSSIASPETYFGSERNEYLANGQIGPNGKQTLVIPERLDMNNLYLGGTWDFAPEYAENTTADARVAYVYNAKNVYMVASSDEGSDVDVYLDGKFLKTITIKDEKLYTIVEGASYGKHNLELRIKKPGLKAFTFTFG